MPFDDAVFGSVRRYTPVFLRLALGAAFLRIVGAGPTGLVLGLWLTTLGVRVRIIDKAAEPGTTSRALAVQVRTLEFYRQVGIADALIAGGVKVAGLNFWVRGAKAARVPLQRIGEGLTPYPFVLASPQDAHERLLIEQLDALGVKVERRTELLDFDQDDRPVRATLKRSDDSEEVCEAAYLAGCDGASSTVREHLAVGFLEAPTRDSSTSPTWRQLGRRRTENSTPISKRPISSSSFP